MIELKQISVQAGGFKLSKISLCIPTGQYGVLMGRTGCGKTTLLEAIIGLKKVSAGRVLIDDADVTADPPSTRGIGYVPQDTALFMSMTVEQHIAFALEIRKAPRNLIRSRVRELAALLHIEHLLKRRPEGLSGGEKQRVALGRALSFQPGVLLLDEPLSALDEDTKDEMCNLLKRIQKNLNITVMHITHSRSEATRLADVSLQMERGNIINEDAAPPATNREEPDEQPDRSGFNDPADPRN